MPFHLTKHDGTVRVFKHSPKGLYYIDTKADDYDETEEPGHYDVNLVNTVEDNRIKYSERDYSKAVLAHKVQKIIGRPSTTTFQSIVDKNLLQNCPVKREYIIAAERIFGPKVGSLMGKTVRRTPKEVQATYTNIPATIMSRYKEVTLACDIMFVNKLPFFVTISRNIRFCTSEFLANRKSNTIFKAINHVHQAYKKRGFKIVTLLMDGEFDKDGLVGEVAELGTNVNCVAAKDHVREIECHIRTIKERSRSVLCMLPFKQLPTRIVIELIHCVIFWLNSFPARKGISNTMSPRALVLGSTIDYATHCKIEFGAYVQTHEPHDNSMLPRTTGAIALRPTGNAQGGRYFYSLTTDKRLHRTQWTELPMPADVIDRVHKLSRRELKLTPLEFADRAGVLIPDDDDDLDDDDDDDDDFDPDDDPIEADVDDWIDGQIAGVDGENIGNEENIDDNEMAENAETDVVVGNEETLIENDEVVANEETIDEDEDAVVENKDAPEDNNDETDDEPPEEPPEFVPRIPRIPRIAAIGHVTDLYNEETAGEAETEEDRNENEEAKEDEVAPATLNVENLMDDRYGKRLGNYNLRARTPRDYSHIVNATCHHLLLIESI